MAEAKTAPTIHEALAAAKAGIGAVGKTGRNQQQGYNFRGVDAVVNAAAPELNKHGVIVTPVLQSIDYDTVEVGQKRTPMAHVRVIVTYRFHGPAGDSIDATVPGESMDSGDKAAPKAMSVAYRIALLQALNLPTDEADPDSQNYERSPREDWRDSPPVSRPRSDANGHAPAHDSWAEDAEAKAPALTSKAAAKALYEETVAKAKAGEITNEQKNHICDLITAQVEHLTAQAAAVTTATVPDGDPWQAKVEEITSKQEADDAIAELDQAHADGHIDDQRHKALRAAMVTKGGSRQGALV